MSGIESGSRLRPKLFRTSLRVRVALGVALPILLVLILLSLIRYQYERRLLEDQVRLTAMQLSDMIIGSLHHALMINDQKMLTQTLVDIGQMENIQLVQIIDLDGQVKADSSGNAAETIWQPEDRGCIECHRSSAESRSRVMRFSTSSGVLRISTPITNNPECIDCHTDVPQGSFLGILLADVSVVDIEQYLRYNLQLDLAVSLGSTMLVTLGLYLLIHWLVVRRVEAFRPALAKLSTGDFTIRLPSPLTSIDELGKLADAFNRMASELEFRSLEQEERNKFRQQTIAEERARIARDLHDGLAQLLGYVNTKAMAVRLMLKNRQVEAADQNLLQLEEAARKLFGDVREAILGLKMAGQEASLPVTLKDFTTQFSRLSDLPVEFTLAPAVENLSLTAETKQQLLRITQESLTNIRKHALASKACVSLQTDGKILELMIGDDGQGFDLDHVQSNDQPHFGLSTMSERAEAIGAEFNLISRPGNGTRVIVRLPLKGLS